MKQSSIDWLIEKLSTIDPNYLFEDGILDLIFNNARKMHRQEIEEAYNSGVIDLTVEKYKGMREYYSEKFKNHDNKS